VLPGIRTEGLSTPQDEVAPFPHLFLLLRFETVSLMLQGEFHHKDSAGNSGILRAGDVQWMTAGSGIVHDEEPSPTFKKTGGVMEGFQVRTNWQLVERA